MPIVANVFNSERAAGVVAVDLEEALSTSTRVIGEHVG
jgi:hypothetical protein